VKSAYGSGQFKKDLDRAFDGDPRVVTSDIPIATASSVRSARSSGDDEPHSRTRSRAQGDRGLRPRVRARLLRDHLRARRLRRAEQVAAYGGFPTRYPHWRFGMEYEQLDKSYSYGLSKIYELVINNDPCYAYLMRSNCIVEQKLVMAHVYGHCDFFKNNLWFAKTTAR
jgi:hypothetical protein